MPAGKLIHAIVDNYATHKHPAGAGLSCQPPALDVPLHADFGLLAERCRGLLRQVHPPAPEPGVFRSVVDPLTAINRFVEETNADPKPFVWNTDPHPSPQSNAGSKCWSRSTSYRLWVQALALLWQINALATILTG